MNWLCWPIWCHWSSSISWNSAVATPAWREPCFSVTLLQRYPGTRMTGLEVDARQHAKNLAEPQENLTFIAAGAEAIPLADASIDLALMLKSLHHVPLSAMAQALSEVARVLRPGGYLYVSEPIYD